ncbi:hypothetical protein JYT48_01165 [Mariprofundus ferrooxydans]|nr:hypothetical protein [Mariprofundus ferrooxydans]
MANNRNNNTNDSSTKKTEWRYRSVPSIISSITLAELLHGAEKSERQEHNLNQVEATKKNLIA